MDEQRMRRLDEAAQKHIEANRESYMTVWDLFAQAQESQTRLAQGLFEGTRSYLHSQTEHTLQAAEELVEQVRRGQEAGRDLARGSARAYDEFLDSLFLYYRESTRATESNNPPLSEKGRPQSTDR
jgi:hypothetical protein